MTKLLAAARGAMIALGLSALGALPAMAQQVMSVDEESIATLLKGEGLKADIVYDEWGGPPMVTSFSSSVKANFEVRLDGCDEEGLDCTIIVFAAGFFFTDDKTPTASHEKINDWNYNNLGKAFVDEGGTMWITTEASLVGGLTKDNLTDTLDWFQGLMRDYTVHIGWQPS